MIRIADSVKYSLILAAISLAILLAPYPVSWLIKHYAM